MEMSPELMTQLGIAAPIFALLTWFLRRSLTVLDVRLASIADRIGQGASEHRAEVRELAEAHAKVVQALIARERELSDHLIQMARETEPPRPK